GKDEKDPVPEKDIGYDLVEMDMKRIRDAGFNAIRTWGLLDEKIVELAAKYDLWVVGGIWTDRIIDLKNTSKIEMAKDHVARQAKNYSRYPNVALLLILNEPEPGILLDVDDGELRSYFDSLVAAAHENCPGIPVSFSNWPIAAFIDSSSWDVISYNLYSNASDDFKKVIDFYDYLNGLKQLKSPEKPFFISEYGFYSPVPTPNPHDIWKFSYVRSEEEQAEKLLADLEIVSQTESCGFTMMQLLDIWFLSCDFVSPDVSISPRDQNKHVHDLLCIEWGGLLSCDEKYEGIPRKAYYAVQKANQAILREPDFKEIYDKEIPIRLYLEDTVKKVKAVIDEDAVFTIPRISPSWAEAKIPVESLTKTDKSVQHQLEIRLLDAKNKAINTLKRSFWTGQKPALPLITIRHEVDQMEWPTFIITLAHPDGTPVSQARIDLAFLNCMTWEDTCLSATTDTSGQSVVVSPDYGPLVMGVRYLYEKNGYSRTCSQLYYYKK
ncbi:MAG: hypothetical protein JW928_09295, partial [Candidatus Aureabacteria bacterium]|nr:hypothetical protein [Candidatus Auribacterota bacterium]